MKPYYVFAIVVFSVRFGASEADSLIERALYGAAVIIMSGVIIFPKRGENDSNSRANERVKNQC